MGAGYALKVSPVRSHPGKCPASIELGGLDLVVNYKASDVSDPVATRSHNLEIMKALLSRHPEMREAFHGLWVYANAENQRPFAIELPMNQIQ